MGMNTPTLLALALLAASLSGSGPETLSQDALSQGADAGVVTDREGVAARKPVLAERWGPADARTPIEPGDWLKTGTRGANALAFELAGGAQVLLGPGALVEVEAPGRLRLARGELRAAASEAAPLEVSGPGDTAIRVTQRSVLRAEGGRLERLAEDPSWLAGYESNTSTEALGSLLANVDGRDVPLTIGYHKVTVDIRDQIARTVVEESFVNHTHTVLEGVFYFPLPADASISGFGMWIGDELVEGDIVEKQRAREIYETILRERRDPGLLEWTGGNIFKARVFPIGAEKRIRIAYTQVLPKEGDTFAYHYALQSELLRKTPLRQLQIVVDVSSAEVLEDVASPSHECRVRRTEHAARVELDAEEYAPDRDFELRLRTSAGGWKATAVPHRRGDEGYFMLLLDTPLGSTGGAPTPSEPLDLLVLADTSGSMWGPARPTQIAFVEALLGALSERDTLNLATCDSAVRFAFERPRAADEGAREEALAFLEAREPLGWSDLDAAFAAAFERAGEHTHVIYVGDGQPTAGDADPVALAHRLRREWNGRGTFHAVVPGSRSERAVLRAIAGLGAGSLRAIDGGSDPAASAFALLREIAAPAVKDLALAFEGMSVAAVYPEVLPNLPLGGQQVVVGRFDPLLRAPGAPEGRAETRGAVTVTGTLDGEPVRFTADVDLDAAERGNSFVPRLWARSHLDELLDQGSSAETQERVIALSEDFQIITPYTSFLVLETDADRERFQVERRFRMRDGEEFFAKGREQGRHELLREQMLAAKTWRKRLRAEILEALGRMNREATELLRGEFGRELETNLALGWASGGPAWSYAQDFDLEGASRYAQYALDARAATASDELFQGQSESAGERAKEDVSLEDLEEEPALESDADFAFEPPAEPPARRMNKRVLGLAGEERAERGLLSELGYAGRADYDYRRYYRDPFDALFPVVGPPRPEALETSWPEDVVRVLASLDRRARLGAPVDTGDPSDPDSGWAITVASEHTDARGRKQTSRSVQVHSGERWVVRGAHLPGSAYALQWLADGVRGHANVGWPLGRVRAAEAGDASAWPAPFAWYFGDELRTYASYAARLEATEDGRVLVLLHHSTAPRNVLVLEIDPARAVLVEQRWTVDGEVASRVVFGAFHEVGGVLWPAEVHSSQPGQEASVHTRIGVETLAAAAFASRFDEVAAPRAAAILLGEQETDLAAAKQAVADGAAELEDRWALLRHFASTQRWELAAPHLAAIEALEAGKPGLAALRATYLQQSRRNEELRALLMQLARGLAAEPREAEHDLATQVMNFTSSLEQGGELLAVLAELEPVFARQTGILDARLAWDQRMTQTLRNMGRAEEAFAQLERMVARYPDQVGVRTSYAHEVAQRGAVDRALAFLDETESESGPWQAYEVAQLRQTSTQILWSSYRLADLVLLVEAWERESPQHLNATMLGQLLSALVFLDREDEAWERVATWLTEYRRPDLEPLEEAHLGAAVQLALGNGQYLYYRRYEDDRAELLVDTARYFAGVDGRQNLTTQIVQHYAFRQTDAARAFLDELYAELEAGVRSLPAQRIALLFGWLRGAGQATDAGDEAWQAILDVVFERWTAVEDAADRAALGALIQSHGRRELVVRYHRRVLETAEGPAATAAAAHALFYYSLGGEWSAEVQAELAGLLPRVAAPADPPTDEARELELRTRVLALYDLATWLPRARADAEVAALPDVNSMPRRLLAARRDEALRAARTATAELFAGLATTLEPDELRLWASIERAYLLVKSRMEIAEAWRRSIDLLGALAEAHAGAELERDVPLRDRILAARSAATAAHLLAHASEAARPELEAALLALLDAGIEGETPLFDWREMKYAVLVALDRGDDVEAALARWYGADDSEPGDEYAKVRWGRGYAHVLAERGELERAALVLTGIETALGPGELTHEDLRSLADWYTALDRADDAREARVRSFEALGERALGQALSAEAQHYQRHGDGVPSELDPEVPTRFVALLRKASSPARWCGLVQSYYAPTQDFRLLECLPEAVLGQSARNIYPFLTNLAGIADLIHEEATVDRLRAHLDALRETRARTDVDRRALALLEFTVVRRATPQAGGTEEHARIALAALRAASLGAWEPGEARLMAELLADQGALEPAELASEQLRQLKELRSHADHAQDRFAVDGHLARTRWAYGEADEAIRTLEAALERLRSESAGRLPRDANDSLTTLAIWLQSTRAYRKAERVWLRELEGEPSPDQASWLELRLVELYVSAVLARAEVSLGSGPALYAAVQEHVLAALARRTNEQHAVQLVQSLCSLWKRAHEGLRYERAGADAVLFAFGGLPAVLDGYQYREGQNVVAQVAECLAAVRDARTALEFLVVRAENEPRWLRLANQEFWGQHSWRLGNLLHRAGRLDRGLEERVLAVVARELREDLRTRESRSRNLYDVRYSHFWSEQREAFRAVALAFLEGRADSGAAVAYATEYLFRGLHAWEPAIEALASACRRGLLDVAGRAQLATFLLERERWAESVPVLARLVQDRPAEVQYRAMLMRAHAGDGDREALARALAAAVAWYREHDAWSEGPIAALASACLATKLLADCVELYDEATALHTKSAPRRGVGDGTLAQYYRDLAGAHSGLGDTDRAIDAAAGAIVCWGRSTHERRQELARLEDVLAAASDLDGYVARLDAECARTGLENPIVRKALGAVYLKREAFEKAVVQLRRALAAQPGDMETHERLVAACDGMRDRRLAAEAQLDWARAAESEIALFRRLGERYAALELEDAAERAYTQLVEALPNESESHALLADVRQEQGCWADAVPEWRHVIRVRTTEPAGYLGLARSLIRLERWDEAREVVGEILAREWDARFGDVRAQGRELLREIPGTR